MTLDTRIQALLSRKFLAPIIAVISLIVWKMFLSAIPIDIYAMFVGSLFGTFLMIEGVKDIVMAVEAVIKKQE